MASKKSAPAKQHATSRIVSDAHKVIYEGVSEDSTAVMQHMTELFNRLNTRLAHIENQVLKIDQVQKDMTSLTSQVHQLEHEMKNIDVKYREISDSVSNVIRQSNEMEKGAQALSDMYDDVKSCLDQNNITLANLKAIDDKHVVDTTKVLDELKELRSERSNLKDLVTDLQCRSMKNNLIFHGLQGENPGEDTEAKLRDFLYYELGIDSHIDFGNVHRFGRFVNGKHRPIVARFIHHKDLELVRDSSSKLRGSSYWINEQFPAEIEDRRRKLYPVLKQYRSEGSRVKLVRDRLYINGKLYQDATSEGTTDTSRPKQREPNQQSYRDALDRTPTFGQRHSKRQRRFTATPTNSPS